MSSFIRPQQGNSTPPPEENRHRSPNPPPYSPLTPELTMATLAPSIDGRVQLSSEASRLPPPTPISESSDPDAIALRSALSVLQLQRLRSIRDVQTLNRQKEKALADPEAFAKALASGEVRTGSQHDLLGILEDEPLPQDEDQAENSRNGVDDHPASTDSAFGGIPHAQSVVRCPPINWAKYGVVGDALESLHEQQKRRPAAGEVQQPETAASPHLVAAPYSPWRDKLPSNPAKPGPEKDS